MSSEGPFEWLAGGLFFGKQKGGIESIDSSKDALSLLQGISVNLDEILAEAAAAAPSATAADSNATEQQQPDSKTKAEEGLTAATSPTSFLAARLSRLRFLLYDERSKNSSPADSHYYRRTTPSVASVAVQALTGEKLHDLILRLLENLVTLPFESRKDVAAIFNYLLVSGLDGSDMEHYQTLMNLFRDYVESHFDTIMTILVQGHEPTCGSNQQASADVVLHYGSMYRVCLRHPCLYRRLVGTTQAAQMFVFPFLDTFVHLPNFDVASDSMETLRLILTAGDGSSSSSHADAAAEQAQLELSELAAEFSTRDYQEIWDKRFNAKLLAESANYMTRRVALQILSTVLLTRSNYAVMIRFVASSTNLILVMKLLRDMSPHITLDAFHVFKIFVANPQKPPEVLQILKDNQIKLCKYLSTLHQEKEASDTQFRDEKALIIATIEAL